MLENHQQADGSVRIPTALRPYLGGMSGYGPDGARWIDARPQDYQDLARWGDTETAE